MSRRVVEKQFAHIEAGVVVNEVQLQQLHAPRDPPRQIEIDVCPSPVEVLQILRRFKNEKVPGPGRLPVDVLKSRGYTIARLLALLLAKASWHAREPISWKGGICSTVQGQGFGHGSYSISFHLHIYVPKFTAPDCVTPWQTSGIVQMT